MDINFTQTGGYVYSLDLFNWGHGATYFIPAFTLLLVLLACIVVSSGKENKITASLITAAVMLGLFTYVIKLKQPDPLAKKIDAPFYSAKHDPDVEANLLVKDIEAQYKKKLQDTYGLAYVSAKQNTPGGGLNVYDNDISVTVKDTRGQHFECKNKVTRKTDTMETVVLLCNGSEPPKKE